MTDNVVRLFPARDEADTAWQAYCRARIKASDLLMDPESTTEDRQAAEDEATNLHIAFCRAFLLRWAS